MGVVVLVLVSELLVPDDEVSIRLVISEYILLVEVDEWGYLFDVLVIQFHLMSVPLHGRSVLLEVDRVQEELLVLPCESLLQGRQAV